MVIKSQTRQEEEAEWTTDYTFDKLAYWNHDTAPTKSDALCRSLEWLALSKQVRTSLLQITTVNCLESIWLYKVYETLLEALAVPPKNFG